MDRLRSWQAALWHSQSARSVAWLTAGGAAAQAVSIVCAPVTTRLYGPEAYGVFGVFLSVLTIFASAGAMGYPMAMVLPKERREAEQLARLSSILGLTGCAILAIVWLAFSDYLKQLRGFSDLGNFTGLLPLALLSAILVQILSHWLTRHKDFKSISAITLANSLWVNGARIVIGLIWPTVATLVWIYIAGQLALVARMIRASRRGDQPIMGAGTGSAVLPAGLREAAIKYRDFPLYRAPQNLINAASQGAPVILLSALSGSVAAGLYSLALQVMGLPSALLGNAVAIVLYPEIAERKHAGRALAGAIGRSTGLLAMLGLLPVVLLCMFAPSAFAVVFGEAWRGAGSYCQWLAIFYFFNFINKPAVAAIPVLGIQGGLLKYEIASTAAKLGALYAGFRWFDSDLVAVALFSVAGAVSYLALIAWVIQVARREDEGGYAG